LVLFLLFSQKKIGDKIKPWIRIRKYLKPWIQIRICKFQTLVPDPDPQIFQTLEPNPDPHETDVDPKLWRKVYVAKR